MRPRIAKSFPIPVKRAKEIRAREIGSLEHDIARMEDEIKDCRAAIKSLKKMPLAKTEMRPVEVEPGEKYDPMEVLFEPHRMEYGMVGRYSAPIKKS